MIKFTTFSPKDNNGQPLITFLNGDILEKTAGYKKDVEDFIGHLEKKADHTYILVNAMTSGDYYGPNLNGDYFPDDQLVRFHKTFEKHAYAYRHHRNKNPQESAGKVIYASHNPDMHRVELVVELDNSKAEDIIERMKTGEFPAVSMGTRTPSDKCSICGNRAKNTGEYCDHLRYEMRRILPDGRRVMAVNDDRLTFFDISFVRIPADRTAGVIAKVASVQDPPAVPSALIGEEWLKRSGLKESALTKEVPGTVEGFSADPNNLILDSQKKIPTPILDKIAEEHSLTDILSTFLGLRIMPRQEEFQRLVLINMDRRPFADQILEKGAIIMDMDEQPQIPIDVTIDGFNHEIAARLMDYIPELSLTKPLIIKRVLVKRADLEVAKEGIIGKMIQKLPEHTVGEPKGPRPSLYSPEKSPMLPLAGLGGLYLGYAKLMNATKADLSQLSKFDQLLMKNQWLIPLFVGAAALGTTTIQKKMFSEKSAEVKVPWSARLLVGIPASYIYAGSVENKLRQGRPITKLEDIARKHPFMTGLTGVGAGSWVLSKAKQDLKKLGSLDRVVYGLGPEKFEELYNDVIGVTNP
jgi:hypothetical protein